jgi:hypothetical protein
MSLFRPRGFFNREGYPQFPQYPHYPQYPQYPQHFPQQHPYNPYFQNMQRHMPYGPQNMPHMPQHSRRQMMHGAPQGLPQGGQAPYHDPSVRFEPMPDGSMPPGIQAQPQMAQPSPAEIQAPSAEVQTPPLPQSAPQGELQNFLQGEANGLRFYENLAAMSGVSEAQKSQISAFLEYRKQNGQQFTNILAGWAPETPEIAQIRSFRDGIAFALMQESQQLRKISSIQRDIPQALIYNKIADIAQLMAISAVA